MKLKKKSIKRKKKSKDGIIKKGKGKKRGNSFHVPPILLVFI
jgi:hypothetical protein